MDGSLLGEAEASVSASCFPTRFSQKASPQRSWGRGLALTGAFACKDYWNSISRARPLPIKIEEEERISKLVL